MLWSHTFPLGGLNQREPIAALTGGQATIGSIAVAVFFVISGYLITWSYERAPIPMQFMRSRVLRILPALFVVLLLIVFVVGPALTTSSLRDYFLSPQPYKFFYGNYVNFFFPGGSDELPGLFANNPFPKAVNGSLWTLGYEFRCYLLVLLLGVVGLLKRSTVLMLCTIMILMMVLVDRSHHLTTWQSAVFTGYFLAGSALYLWKPSGNLFSGLLALAALVGAAIFTNLFVVAMASAGAYLVIYMATWSVRVPYISRFGDLSYGIYIYAFPVQQAAAQFFGESSNWLLNGLVSTPIVLVLAGLSWIFIEKPALALKARSSVSGVVSKGELSSPHHS